MLVAVDLGNTALKLGAFDGARLVATERFDVPRSLAEDLVPTAHFLAADEAVVLASSPRRLAEFADWTPRPVRVLGDEVRSAVRTAYARPSELGLDRIAAAVGARAAIAAMRARAVAIVRVRRSPIVAFFAPRRSAVRSLAVGRIPAALIV